MNQYLDLVRIILSTGTWQENRTGVRAISIPGAMLRFDLKQCFPVVTTKKLAFRSAFGELVGFLRSATSAADFRALGCNIWDANANVNTQWLSNPYRNGTDDLGNIYGAQWRRWSGYKVLYADACEKISDAIQNGFKIITKFNSKDGVSKILLYKEIDQLRQCLDKIMSNPSDRRILFHGWNPAELDQISLPACHLLYQFLPNSVNHEISLCLYIRSNDIGLGTPFNMVEGAALLSLIGRLTGYTPRWFTYFIGDAHIYENQIDMLQHQLDRNPYESPRLVISDRVPEYIKTGIYAPEWLEKIEPSDFSLEGYRHHEPLTSPMAV
ncbi:MAG: thymidylate synthase [Burkholderia sp.]|nr:thymidylate synthase [Burkholderia sp.]